MKLPEKPFDWESLFNRDSYKIIETIKKNDLLKQVSEYNKRYLYWSEIKYRVKNDLQRRYIWAFMKFFRSEKYEEISFNYIKMKYSLLSDFNRKLCSFDKFLAGNIEIQTKSLGLQKSYIISSLMEEAIASSMIEGAATTRSIAKRMLREKRKPRTKDEKMISNNYETMQYILTQKDKKMSPQLLLEIQKRITRDTLENQRDEGMFREGYIEVGHSDMIAHIPPNYKEIPKLIEEFCAFTNTDSEKFIHPILKAIILHFLIGYIHPFNDGNGRTARSVFYWYLLSKGYWLLEYMAVSKMIIRSRRNYDLAYLYSEYDEMDLTYFIKYMLDCIEYSLKDTLDYIKNKQHEQGQVKKIISENPTLNLRQAMIIEEFMKNPSKIFTIKEIAEIYHIVYQTARSDLLFLNKKGFIDKQISGRTFVFMFHELI